MVAFGLTAAMRHRQSLWAVNTFKHYILFVRLEFIQQQDGGGSGLTGIFMASVSRIELVS